ncbi:MAG: alginate export family protein [Opitutae bacterium]|nr:alginate export family protein [Opitutae bacterium]
MKRHLACLLLATGAGLAADPADFATALAQGKFSVNARLRSESVEQTGLRDAHALTLRTRLGFAPVAFRGWKFLVEAENIVAADGDSYSQAGLNAGGAGKAVVADPESTEINQAFVSYTSGQTTVTLGRQRLVLDNARFVGDVGWRQNMQTFDAVVVQDKSLNKTTLTYAWLDRINRVFGDRHAQGYWQSNSHLLNASYAGLPAGTLTGYAYLLDFRRPAYAANSSATYGISFVGATRLTDALKLTYRAEAATQGDYGSSRLNYRASYYDLEAGLAATQGGLTLGHEVLGSGNGVGFKTPLATLHAFNGWADLFLATPAAGLRDTYVKASLNLPAAVSLLAFQHWYETDATGARLGAEFNVQLTRKFGKYFTGLVKFADFRRDSPALPDVRKVWVQAEFAY